MENEKNIYMVSCRTNVEVEIDPTQYSDRHELREAILAAAKAKVKETNENKVQYTVLNDPTFLAE